MDLTPDTWLSILASAFTLFDDAEARGFGTPPFALGGGTVLMLAFQHRLSKDIDFFGYDAQWLGVLSPRLNEKAASLAATYVEQANFVKIVMAEGDIDLIIAADALPSVKRARQTFLGREISVEPSAEILAKKLLYRAASLAPRDIYDLSAAIDLVPDIAAQAAKVARSKRDALKRRFEELAEIGPDALLAGIVPYDGTFPHAAEMIAKVRDFVLSRADGNDADARR